MSRAEVLRVLRRAGFSEVADELSGLLPDPADLDRDAALLGRYGISRDELVNRMGRSS